MHVAVATPPDPVVSLAEAKAHLRVEVDDDDDLIEALVAAATAVLDGPSGWLNRALGEQVLVATIEGFPHGDRRPGRDLRHDRRHGLALRCEPISAIGEITYLDTAGDEQTLDPEVYELTADGCLRLAYGQSWPTPRSCEDPVTITYTAGYAALPGPLRAAILLMVGDLYANRETGVVGVTSDVRMTTTVDRLISPYRNLRA